MSAEPTATDWRREASNSVTDLHGGGDAGARRRRRARKGHRLPPHGGRLAAALHVHAEERARIRRRKIAAKVRAPALGTLAGGGHDEAGGIELVAHVEPVLPRRVERQRGRHAHALCTRGELVDG